LNYRGSQIAACCVIIAANMQKRDDYKIMYKYEDSRKVSPKKRNTDGLMSNVNTSYSDLNIDLWNTELAQVSGYTTQVLRAPLYSLCKHIQKGLPGNTLDNINFQNLKPSKEILSSNDILNSVMPTCKLSIN